MTRLAVAIAGVLAAALAFLLGWFVGLRAAEALLDPERYGRG